MAGAVANENQTLACGVICLTLIGCLWVMQATILHDPKAVPALVFLTVLMLFTGVCCVVLARRRILWRRAHVPGYGQGEPFKNAILSPIRTLVWGLGWCLAAVVLLRWVWAGTRATTSSPGCR